MKLSVKLFPENDQQMEFLFFTLHLLFTANALDDPSGRAGRAQLVNLIGLLKC